MSTVRVFLFGVKVFKLSFEPYIYEGYSRVIMDLTIFHKPVLYGISLIIYTVDFRSYLF